mgnify:CR=1 FL=1
MLIKNIVEYFRRRSTKIELTLISLFLGFFGIIGGLWIFLIGFHNIDLVYNFVGVSLILEEENIILKDHTLNDTFVTLEELYRIGAKQLLVSVFVLLFSTFIFAISLSELIMYTDDRTN